MLLSPHTSSPSSPPPTSPPSPGKPIENLDCGINAAQVPAAQEIKEGEQIVYTYDVFWQISETRWASRWDAYLRMPGGKVHWWVLEWEWQAEVFSTCCTERRAYGS